MQRGRKRKTVEDHPIELVKQLLDLTTGEKDYLLVERADLSRSYLSQLRHARYADPGIKSLIKLAEALDYKIVLQWKYKED